jgi:hypothetical protein
MDMHISELVVYTNMHVSDSSMLVGEEELRSEGVVERVNEV